MVRFLIAALVAFMVMVPSVASAAKPGDYNPVMTVAGTGHVVGDTLHVTGSGFAPSQAVYVILCDPYSCVSTTTLSDAAGSFPLAWTATSVGLYRFTGGQNLRGNFQMELQASVSVLVE